MRLLSPAIKLSIVVLLMPSQTLADFVLAERGDSSLSLSGDWRLRLENDWSSARSDGAERDDRLRLRARARVRLDVAMDDKWSGVLRIRSGSDDSQQSPHITLYDFDDNDTGDADFNADLWYGQYRHDDWKVWAGRNQINLWLQDELLLDSDVTSLGIGIDYQHQLGEGQLTWKGGLGSLPVGMQATSGQYNVAQLVYERDTESHGFTLAAGYLGVDGDPDDPDGSLLLTDNTVRDYQTGVLQAQWRQKSFGRPLKIGITGGHNFENYADDTSDSFGQFHQDATDFYVVFVNWGTSKQRGDWLLGYYYAHIEALAFNSAYSQDDWVRWGSATQTRSTNFEGSEFRIIYTLAADMNIVGRLYIVDAIDLLDPGDLAKEDGNRARVDFNFKF